MTRFSFFFIRRLKSVRTNHFESILSYQKPSHEPNKLGLFFDGNCPRICIWIESSRYKEDMKISGYSIKLLVVFMHPLKVQVEALAFLESMKYFKQSNWSTGEPLSLIIYQQKAFLLINSFTPVFVSSCTNAIDEMKDFVLIGLKKKKRNARLAIWGWGLQVLHWRNLCVSIIIWVFHEMRCSPSIWELVYCSNNRTKKMNASSTK